MNLIWFDLDTGWTPSIDCSSYLLGVGVALKLQVPQKPYIASRILAPLIEFEGAKKIIRLQPSSQIYSDKEVAFCNKAAAFLTTSRLFTGTQQQSTYGFVNSISIRLYPKPTHSNYTSQSPTGRFKLINLDIWIQEGVPGKWHVHQQANLRNQSQPWFNFWSNNCKLVSRGY